MSYQEAMDPDLMTDAELAAQLQRQFDDEEMLTSRLNSSFNFLSTSHHAEVGPSKASAEQDEEMARKLQRRFYIDMKKQGYTDMDLASMLDTMGEETQLEQALRESVGDPAQTCVEKYIVTLYNNSKYNMKDTFDTPGLEEITEFREQVVNSLCFMSQERIIDPTETAEYIARNFIFESQNWNELEAAYFLLKPLIPNVSPWLNLHLVSPTATWIDILYKIALTIQDTNNQLLMVTMIRFINISKRFVFMKNGESAKFATWYLSIPPLERYIPEVTLALCQLSASAVNRLFPFFEQMYDYIRIVELSTQEGVFIEESVHNILKACTSVINDQGSDCIVSHLEMLFNRPLEAIGQILSHCDNFEASSPSPTWVQMAKTPSMWLKRINSIIGALGTWACQRAYTLDVSNRFESRVPWADLFTEVVGRICVLISIYNDNMEIVENTLTTIFLLANAVGKQCETIFTYTVQSMDEGYQRNNSLEFLGAIESAVFKVVVLMESPGPAFPEFINKVINHIYSTIPAPFQSPESIPYYKRVFTIVNRYCVRRINDFIALPVFETTFELAVECADKFLPELFCDAHEFLMTILTYMNPHVYLREQKSIGRVMDVLDQHGRRLVMVCCKNALTATSPEVTTSGTTILQTMKNVNEQRTAQWVTEYLDENYTGLSPTQRSRFIEEFITCNDKESLYELANQFSKNFVL